MHDSGRITSSEEGEIFWIKCSELKNYVLADDFEEMIKIFESDNLSEFYYYKDMGKWNKKIL